MSMKFTPAASICTSTWPGPGAGRSISSYRSASGPPGACTRIAFIRVSTVFPGLVYLAHMKISFLGLGSMGLPMARHLLQAGHTLTVYNRTRARAEHLKQFNPVVADSPA